MIRLSGPESWAVAAKLRRGNQPFEPGKVTYDWLVDPEDGGLLDEVLILPFKGPRSFTGEDCIEIHCHGGLGLTRTILSRCFEAGARPAEPGEFTRRAVLNGRIDLTQAESILDLIHAQGEALIKLSAHNLHHRAAGRFIAACVDEIAAVQADMVASIDFPDEVDEPDREILTRQLAEIRDRIGRHLAQSRHNQVIREGMTVVLAGLPNAGKSSLFNALLRAERAIVTEIPGTTRDTLQETLMIRGIPFTLTDTAGLREGEELVERIGVERSWDAMAGADAVVFVLDGCRGLDAENRALLEKITHPTRLLVLNKQDAPDFRGVSAESVGTWPVVAVSAQQGTGLDSVMQWLEAVAEARTDITGMEVLLSRRQMEQLASVEEAIAQAGETLQNINIPLDLATVPLTDALLALQGLLGRDTTEMVLDSVFSRFCVGK